MPDIQTACIHPSWLASLISLPLYSEGIGNVTSSF
jgi:hypothetical protein